MNDLKQALKPLRLKINAIDEQIIKLLNERGNLSLEVGKIKRAADPQMNNIRNRERELEILSHITHNNHGPFSDKQLRTIYELIFEEHRNLQQGIKHD